jgi:transcriptional regulator with XRE-family HTH domain
MNDLNAGKKLTVPDGFPRRLRELRKQKNLSQTELGKLVNLHYTHIGRYERGISRPAADTLKRLADAWACRVTI